MNWSTACLDWQRRVISGETLITFPPLFPAEAEYNRLLHKRATPEELATGYIKLCNEMNRLNIQNNNICDNDTSEEPYP